jgi:hypothetical protein
VVRAGRQRVVPRRASSGERDRQDRRGGGAGDEEARLCRSHPEPAGLSRIVTIDPRRPTTTTFDPRAIPAGMELSVGRFFLEQHLQLVEAVLIRTGSYSCTDHVPTDRPAGKPGHAIGFIAIPARQATSHG